MSDEFSYTFKRHDIALTRDSEDKNWYIRVRGPDGLHKYDGYWRDSARKTLKEALQEAKEGAMLVSPPSPWHPKESTMSEIELPPQPTFERVMEIAGKHDTEKNAGLAAFARELMDVYGKACARAAMERAAQICNRYAAEWIKAPGLAAEFRSHGASDCEEEIRAAKDQAEPKCRTGK